MINIVLKYENNIDALFILINSIFEIYKEDYTDIKIFYRDLSLKLEIPEINLDAIIWVNYEKLI